MKLSVQMGIAGIALSFGLVGCGARSEKVETPANVSSATALEKDVVGEERGKLSPEDRALVDAQEWCVVSNEGRLGSMGAPIKLAINGQPVFICCEGCKTVAEKDPEATLAKLAELKAKKAGTATTASVDASAVIPAPAQAAPPAVTPGKLVDATEALKDPKVVVASTKITGQDPLTASMQAYFSIPAKAQILNFQNQVKITRALNDDKPLSFTEFSQLAQQMKIEFIPLLPWQMIGYDPKTSELVLLEDKGVKIQHYKAKNIPLDAGDEKYDTP